MDTVPAVPAASPWRPADDPPSPPDRTAGRPRDLGDLGRTVDLAQRATPPADADTTAVIETHRPTDG
jgi:hypothetical protein